jgi:hypothetical protein
MNSLRIALIGILTVLAVASVLVIAELFAIEPKCQIGVAEALCLLTGRETLATGLLAAGGVAFAGWLGWHIYAQQEASTRRSGIRRQVARGDAVTSELMMIADLVPGLGRHHGSLDVFLGSIAETSITEVAEIEPHLAAALAAYVLDLRRFRENHTVMQTASLGHGVIQRFPQEQSDFSFRSEVLSAAINKACQRLDARETISSSRLVDRSAAFRADDSNGGLTSRP